MARRAAREPTRSAAWALLCAAVAVLVWRPSHVPGGLGFTSAPLRRRGLERRGDGQVDLRAIIQRPIGGPIQRPIGGPPVRKKLAPGARVHMPKFSNRARGPIRSLLLNRTLWRTLEAGVSLDGRGGLNGRYREEVLIHLDEMARLRAGGQELELTLFWDFENMRMKKWYKSPFRDMMLHVLEWLAGIVDHPLTRVEAVEITRLAKSPQHIVNMGSCDWYQTLRQVGGVVHRAWPPNTDAADEVLWERLRDTLDEIQQGGGPKRIIAIASGDKAFLPMIESAQSDGVPVVLFTPRGLIRYYVPGTDFSIPIQWDNWYRMQIGRELYNTKLDMMRNDEEFLPHHGPKRWNRGLVALSQVGPDEELDRRRFHDWHDADVWTGREKHDGSWVRAGLRLNDTIVASLQRALARNGTEGTRTGRLRPEARGAVEKDLADLAESAYATAAVFWNNEDMRIEQRGPPRYEMLGRVIRWCEGFLGMPVKRVEVSRYVEPWDKFGSHGNDWLYDMDQAGMFIHRVWPPRSEATNTALTRSIGAIVRAAVQGLDKLPTGTPVPRMICVFSEDLYFDDDLRAAQKAGISALWFGLKERGVYYPANSEEQVRVDVVFWKQTMLELSEASRDPYLPGVHTPDAPLALGAKTDIPVDLTWGKTDDLGLDSSDLQSALEGMLLTEPVST